MIFDKIARLNTKKILSFNKQLRQRLKEEDSEQLIYSYFGIGTFVLFTVGVIYDTGIYLIVDDYLPVIINLLTLVVYVVIAILYLRKKLSVFTLLALLLYSTQINVSATIFYSYHTPLYRRALELHYDFFIGFVINIIAALTLKKRHVFILSYLPLLTYAVLLTHNQPNFLLGHFFTFCVAYLSIPPLLAHIRRLLWESIHQKELLLKEKQLLCRMMKMDGEQQLSEIMHGVPDSQLVIRAKRLLAKEVLIEQINQKQQLSLTANEIQLCGFILADKSITEISRLLFISESTVRANRSRIRRKLGLKQNMNLKAHLLALTRAEDNESHKPIFE